MKVKESGSVLWIPFMCHIRKAILIYVILFISLALERKRILNLAVNPILNFKQSKIAYF